MEHSGYRKPDGVSEEVWQRARKIRLLLMDVDGVMTNGTITFAPGPDGQMWETKGFNSLDGLGLHFCHAVGLPAGVISGVYSPATVARAKMLHMPYIYQGNLNKEGSYNEILAHAQVSEAGVAYIGDDFTDVPLMRRSGLAVAVKNAQADILPFAHYQTQRCGGEGAVREVIEILLKAQGTWTKILQQYKVEG